MRHLSALLLRAGDHETYPVNHLRYAFNLVACSEYERLVSGLIPHLGPT